MVRGSKHWSLQKQRALWGWLTPLLPSIYDGITPETQLAWEMCTECSSPFLSSLPLELTLLGADILTSRDPRRNAPLIEYITSFEIDPEASEAFNTAKRLDSESLVSMRVLCCTDDTPSQSSEVR